MYKILICDDDAIFVKELEKLIKECNKNKRELEFTRYYSGEDLLNNLQMDRMKTCFTMEASYNREKVVLQTSDIVYFTHHKKGSIIHLNKERSREYPDAKLITPYNFKELQEMLYYVGFACPHNSYLVNMRYISAFNMHKEFLELDGKRIPAARGKTEQFSKEFTRYVKQKYRENLR